MNESKKQFNPQTLLAIESSCDETAVAILRIGGNQALLSDSFVASQQTIHARYGGVVPEVAARAHIGTIIPLIQKALKKSVPDYIAVTAGPGLITSLLVGVHTARALSYLYKKPLLPINHIEGHIYANWFNRVDKTWCIDDSIEFPALALIVSGGHTELILMEGHGRYKKIGQTLDDAAGEAFDKAAKILDLGYPGGPAIAARASFGNRLTEPLPIPMAGSKNFSFSFSGLKTAVLYRVRDLKRDGRYSNQKRDDLCAAFQYSVVSTLVAKTLAAIRAHTVKTVLLGGGVAANKSLRETLARAIAAQASHTKFVVAPLQYCTDNAAMIAAAAFFHLKRKKFASPLSPFINPLWNMSDG